MRKLRAALFALLPSFLSTFLWKRCGARIASGARVRLGAWVETDRLELGPGATIGPLAFVQTRSLVLGARASIKPLSFTRSHTVVFGAHTRNSPLCIVMGTLHPRSRLVVGDHGRIFPFCWLEPGEGITLGNHVGVGGHSFIFSHGAWSDYLAGGPVRFEGVRIGDNVWLPWRVTVLAGAVIGNDAIVMAGSVVSRPVPDNVIAGGAPAKVLKERGDTPSAEERSRRALDLLRAYASYRRDDDAPGIVLDETHRTIAWRSAELRQCDSDAEASALPAGSLAFFVSRSPSEPTRADLLRNGVTVVDYPAGRCDRGASCVFEDFLEFLGNYGVRLYESDSAPASVPATRFEPAL